jgi:2-keto-4-pentenoate hydratase/2-oxohepta-3-ene-1,7-dioic acid hydratase in catechol pathway
MTTIPNLDLPIRTIFCIGRNYLEHARELGNPRPAEPVVFLKPVSAVCADGEAIVLPVGVGRVDHEVELVVAIGRAGRRIAAEHALHHVAGYGVGIDVTARDLQDKAKQKALPWAVAKGYDTFAPLGSFVPAAKVPDPSALTIRLAVNSEIRQNGRTADMIWDVAALIAYTSSIFSLAPGDLIFTGTPSGVGPLAAGDRLVAALEPIGARLEIGVVGGATPQ